MSKEAKIPEYTGKVWCDNCNRDFAGLQYFSTHIFAKSNISCYNYFIKNTSQKHETLGARALKRRKLMQRREAIIRGAEALLNEEVLYSPKPNQTNKYDDSVFEFVDDSPPEESFPRVNDASTSSRKPAARTTTLATTQQAEGETRANEEAQGHNEQALAPNEGLTVNLGQNALNEGTDPAQTHSSRQREPNRSEMEQFKAYVDKAHRENLNFSREMEAGIELMHKMNQKGGSLELFDEVSKWHVDHSDSDGYVTAEKLHKDLIERYNLEKTLPKERTVLLPHSKEEVNLAIHDVRSQTTDLLTDPRVKEDDYLFFNDDPLAGPPDEIESIGDVNTTKAYTETYKKLIAPEPWTKCGRRKVLLPYILYLDGCVTGHYCNLAIEILKFTIGLFKGKTRNQSWAWRNIGLVKKLFVPKKKAEENIRNSEHIDSGNILPEVGYRAKGVPQAEGPTPEFEERKRKRNASIPEVKAQDFHKMLQVLLSSYKEIEEDGGIEWDLRHRNQIQRLLLIPFIIFCKADSVEADKMCGTYGSKTEGVKCLCRVCTCPTNECSNPYLHPAPPKKTPQMIRRLVRMGNDASRLQLKSVSQHELWNPMYELRFGQHDNTGVHGAIPWEVLHQIQINMFKQVRDCLFAQTGDKSELSRNLDSLCITMGTLLKRQSDRALPRTMFRGGVREGLLQAHHMSGIMIVLALCLRSTQGRDLLLNTSRGAQKEFFNTAQQVRDWSHLVETLLMFERWLKKDEFDPNLVNRAKVKVKEVMCMVRTVGQRRKGMGDNRGVFHGLIHLPEMILNLGAPKHFDTQHNESDHKMDKKTAKRTQQRAETFDMDIATKIQQRHAVDLGMHELKTGKRRWHYYRRLMVDTPTEAGPTAAEMEPILTGTVIRFKKREDTGEFLPHVVSRSVDKDRYMYDEQVLAMLQDLAIGLEELIPNLECHGILKVYSPKSEDNRQIYHAEPFYQGSPWYDWGVFQWSDEPGQPRIVLGQMKCFIDLRSLPEGNDKMEPGIYIMMEIATKNAEPDEQQRSDLFEPWLKKPSDLGPGWDQHCQLELVHIDNLRLPAVVVPDLANQNNRAYLRMVPIWQWEHMFDDWLEDPHRRLWDN